MPAGVQFLFRQYSQGIGGILADDMGLGKTIQTIAFCAALLGKTGTAQDSTPQPSVAGKRQAPAPCAMCVDDSFNVHCSFEYNKLFQSEYNLPGCETTKVRL